MGTLLTAGTLRYSINIQSVIHQEKRLPSALSFFSSYVTVDSVNLENVLNGDMSTQSCTKKRDILIKTSHINSRNLQNKTGKLLIGWLNCPQNSLSHVLNHCCPVFFFPTPIDNFCHHVKTPAARGSAVFHSMENRWRGRAEMAAWKKRRDSHTETHTEIRQNTAHRVPMRAIWGSVCVCLSVCICVWWVAFPRVLVKAVCMLWCVWQDKLG